MRSELDLLLSFQYRAFVWLKDSHVTANLTLDCFVLAGAVAPPALRLHDPPAAPPPSRLFPIPHQMMMMKAAPLRQQPRLHNP